MSDGPAKSLASYVPWLARAEDGWRLRIVLHDFAMWWHDTPVEDRLDLVAEEPASIEPRWDAFLAAWVEHHCWHDRLRTPDWVFAESRYLAGTWFPGTPLPSLRIEALVHSPAAFEAHGVLLCARELVVV